MTADESFESFMAGALPGLLRFGHVLTGDPHRAEELVRSALVKTYQRWGRVDQATPHAYVRAAMVNTHTSWWRLLTDALHSARTDQRWAVPPRPDMTHRVRRAVRRRRGGQVALAVAAAVIVLPGAVLGLAALSGDERSQDEVFAGAPLAPGEPVPGIAPEFAPSSGSDWLLTEKGFERFAASHSVPSSRPNPIQSPGPLTDYSARLLADVEAGLPTDATTERQDALNGDPATAGIHVLLPDGTPVEVEREPLQAPVAYPLYFGGAQRPVPPPAVVAGSDSAVLSVQEVGYGWGPGIPAGARSVTVVRRDGEATRWYAPLYVPLDTVTRWALAAEANGRS